MIINDMMLRNLKRKNKKEKITMNSEKKEMKIILICPI
jgi:hypothetical protein